MGLADVRVKCLGGGIRVMEWRALQSFYRNRAKFLGSFGVVVDIDITFYDCVVAQQYKGIVSHDGFFLDVTQDYQRVSVFVRCV